jgi:hypothetical protein
VTGVNENEANSARQLKLEQGLGKIAIISGGDTFEHLTLCTFPITFVDLKLINSKV